MNSRQCMGTQLRPAGPSRLVSVSAVLLAVTMAACGGSGSEAADAERASGSSGSAAVPLPDPCTLLAADEIEETLDWRVGEMSLDTTSIQGAASCDYKAADRGSLLLMLKPSSSNPDRDSYRQHEESYRETWGMDELQFIDDIGSAAVWSEGLLTVAVPGFEIQLMRGDAALTLAQARSLMEKALARLH